jgi:pyocin large subunit-like protein
MVRAATDQMWTATKQRTPTQNAFRHFKDHGADFAAKNAIDYVRQANEFMHNPPPGTLTRFRPNGDVIRYDPITSSFGVMTANGLPRTFFKPNPAVHGFATNRDYFNAQ